MLAAAFCLLLRLSFGAQTGDLLQGEIRYAARREQGKYILSLRFCLPEHKEYSIRALKITYDPGGVVPMIVYDNKCPRNVREGFPGMTTPLASVEAMFDGEVDVEAVIAYSPLISKCDTIKLDYIIEKNEKIASMSIAGGVMKNPDDVEVSLVDTR